MIEKSGWLDFETLLGVWIREPSYLNDHGEWRQICHCSNSRALPRQSFVDWKQCRRLACLSLICGGGGVAGESGESRFWTEMSGGDCRY